MLRRDARRLRTVARDTERRVLAEFLAWSVRHACTRAGLVGRIVNRLALDQAATATLAYLRELADAGAFRYFGIRDRYELGDVPLRIGTSGGGVVSIANALEACDHIRRGGARSQGWLAPHELTADDLAR